MLKIRSPSVGVSSDSSDVPLTSVPSSSILPVSAPPLHAKTHPAKKTSNKLHSSFMPSIVSVLFSVKISVLTIFMPVTVIPYYFLLKFSPESLDTASPYLFLGSLLALVPFAERLGYITEQLALHTNDTYSGLLNATFGNFSELILSLLAMHKRLYRVVQLSLLGSILSNLLLVLGCSCLLGGYRFRIQRFTTVSGAVSSGMLMVATAGLVLPCALKMSGQEDDALDEINFSRGTALVMFFMYWCYLLFSLKTNQFEFDSVAHAAEERNRSTPKKVGDGHDSDGEEAEMSSLLSSAARSPVVVADVDDDDEDAVMTYDLALKWLFAVTAVVGFLSDVLVGTIEAFTERNGLNPVFTAAIVIPIFGNAAEHAASVMFAYRNKMDICLGIAVGSSIQIALCVVPACVLLGWATDRDFSLFFEGYETACLVMTVMTVSFFLIGGTSNWLIGALFIGLYIIIAFGFWIHEKEGDSPDNPHEGW
ncbi:hypothetical protein TrST_g5527 [Triparma strigata]|uniref:Sodium/calcium exchanger membrane region domain-containing protein n=1 Tax=Triparma strigata TaxID=1606541 RepID=A0A9W7BPN3_9STRA|nr:hypothetical protein TrST_g5527 [Triparma strigata]